MSLHLTLQDTFNQPSPYGGLMVAVCLLGGSGMFAFESVTFMRETVYVMPWLWKMRTVLYTALALPGLFAAPQYGQSALFRSSSPCGHAPL